jgi:hypothetical protein
MRSALGTAPSRAGTRRAGLLISSTARSTRHLPTLDSRPIQGAAHVQKERDAGAVCVGRWAHLGQARRLGRVRRPFASRSIADAPHRTAERPVPTVFHLSQLGGSSRQAVSVPLRSQQALCRPIHRRMCRLQPPRDVRFVRYSGQLLLTLTISGFDPGRAKTFSSPKRLPGTGGDPRQRDRLSMFLLLAAWSQSSRKFGPC